MKQVLSFGWGLGHFSPLNREATVSCVMRDMYEEEILTRETPRERLDAFIELISRDDHWPAGSANKERVQAVVLRDLAVLVLGQGLPDDVD
ncbi:hypothetical protein [Deinococcus enclensis]|uniref:Uncharacterized protein n=1 Tax=Deinococcus enclensis TaxID=1049582 RepID=A0ABT9ME63_9DEIO|nr:hypothetical protein [Deinococcus enclensis]MDP9764887.1 hypothetical protein [Deinococcus enclensis]